jgi:hypothetical protein
MKITDSKRRANDRIIDLHFLSFAAKLNYEMVMAIPPSRYRTFLMRGKFHQPSTPQAPPIPPSNFSPYDLANG